MAEGKKSFVLYADLIHTVSKMPNDKAGELLKHILKYVNDEEPETDDLIIQLTFEPIKQQLKRDLKKYENKRKQWSEAGKRSAEARKANKIERTLTNVKSVATVSTVNDNVSVNDNDIITTTNKIKKIDVVYSEFVKQIKNGEHSQWAEQTYMQLKLKKGSLTTLINNFKSHLVRTETVHDTVSQFKTHLNNWLNQLETIGKLNEFKKQKIGAL